MKLLILGATGPSGQNLVTEALERGHEVIALVRSPEKLTTQHERLKVIQGNCQSADDLRPHLAGCDAVMSCLGGKPGLNKPCDIYSTSAKALSEAMKEVQGVERFLCITAWGTKDDPRLPFIWRWVLKPSLLKNVVNDMSVLEDYLASDQCSHINYTVVRPPRLTDTPSQGGEVQVQEDQLVDGANNVIGRQDLAKFMLDCLNTKQWDRKMVSVAGPKKDS